MNLSSKNKRILIVSDIHQDIDRLSYILNKENYDTVVCLGDWFDSFDFNSKRDIEKTCDFLKKWINKENFYTLVGNHDLMYLYSNKYTICSGYTREKDKLITSILGAALPFIRKKFLWYLWVDDFLCTHAGIHPCHLPPMIDVTDKNQINKFLDEQIVQAELHLINDGSHWFYRAGQARYGNQKFGGITWLDWNQEFEPIEDLGQIVGHTVAQSIRPHHNNGSLDIKDWKDICIDCHLGEYLVIDNGKLLIRKYSDL